MPPDPFNSAPTNYRPGGTSHALILALGIALAAAVIGYGWGKTHEAARWQKQQADSAASLLTLQKRLDTAQGQVSDRVVTEYVDRVQVVRGKTQTLIQKVPVYVPQKPDPKCRPGSADLPGGFRVLHDLAIRPGGLPDGDSGDAARAADAAPVAVQAAAATVVENYGAGLENAERLTALQDWVRAQHEAAQAAVKEKP